MLNNQTIKVCTLNCGTHRKLLREDGKLTQAFAQMLIEHLNPLASYGCVLCLQETYANAAAASRLRCALQACGFTEIGHTESSTNARADHGTAMYVANLPTLTRVIRHRFVSVDIPLSRSTQRIVIATTYLPHGPQLFTDMKTQCEMLGPKVAAGNRVALAGDFNTSISPTGTVTSRPWTAQLRLVGITRVIPQARLTTSKQGHGSAIGVMASAALHQSICQTMYTTSQFNLSDHHLPLFFALEVTTCRPAKRARILQHVPTPTYNERINQAGSFHELCVIMADNTVCRSLPHPPSGGKKLADYFRKSYAKLIKAIPIHQRCNPKRALQLVVFGTISMEVDLPANANSVWGPLLEDRWKAHPLDTAAVTRLCSCIPPLTDAEVTSIMQPITVTELLQAIAKWGARKTFSDYTVRCISLLNETQMSLVATELSSWLSHLPPNQRTTIGLQKPGAPTAIPQDPANLELWMQKYIRPLMISPIFHALFNGVMARRLRAAIPRILSPSAVGFLPDRSTHHIILSTVLAIAAAEHDKADMWFIAADIEKAYDHAAPETQSASATQAGLGSLSENLMRAHFAAPTQVRLVDGPAATAQAETSFGQGDATVCSRFPLTIDPAIRMARTQALEFDPLLYNARIDNWADDIFLRTRGCNALPNICTLLNTVEQALNILGYRFGSIKVACNEQAWKKYTYWDNSKMTLQTLGKELPIAGALRILGACVHFRPDSACTEHRCALCKAKQGAIVPVCPTCAEAIPQGLAEWHASPLDKVALYKSVIIPAILYAPYACVAQQQWAARFHQTMRLAITRAGFGGYNAIHALPPQQGGLGLTEMKHLIAIQTIGIMNRELSPVCEQSRDALTSAKRLTRDGIVAWPPSILTAIEPFQLHINLDAYDRPACSSQQENSVACATLQHVWSATHNILTTVIDVRSNIFPKSCIQVQFAHQTRQSAELYTIAYYAQHLRQRHHKVAIQHSSQHVDDLIVKFRKNNARTNSQHPFNGLLNSLTKRNTVIHLKSTTEQPLVQHTEPTPPAVWLHEITWQDTPIYSSPVWLASPHGSSHEGNAMQSAKDSIRWKEFAQVNEAKQMVRLFAGRQPNWKLSSLANFVRISGCKYEHELDAGQLTFFLGLRAGAFTKSGSFCQCTQPLSLEHLFSHFTYSELQGLEEKAASIRQNPEVQSTASHLSLWKASPATCTGWVFGQSSALDRHKNKKAITHLLRSAILIFVVPFINLARHYARSDRFNHDRVTRPPAPETAPSHHAESDTCDWKLFTDAALSDTNPQIGIGVYITHMDQPWHKEALSIPRTTLPGPVTSTIAEYAAAEVGLRIASHRLPLPVHQLLHYVDNLAVPQQANGNWHMAKPETLAMVTRYRRARDEAPFQVTSLWIPRAANVTADQLAATAAKGHTGIIPHAN